jgi:hypothetical protein
MLLSGFKKIMLLVLMISGPVLIVIINAACILRCCIKRRQRKQKAKDQAKKLNVTLQKLEDSPSMTKRHPSFSSSQQKVGGSLEYKLSNSSYQYANDHDYSDGNSVDSSYCNYYQHSANGSARDHAYRVTSSPNHYARPHQQTSNQSLTPSHSPVYRVCRTPPSIPGSPRHYSTTTTHRQPPSGSGSRHQTYHMVVGSDLEESGSVSATV